MSPKYSKVRGFDSVSLFRSILSFFLSDVIFRIGSAFRIHSRHLLSESLQPSESVQPSERFQPSVRFSHLIHIFEIQIVSGSNPRCKRNFALCVIVICRYSTGHTWSFRSGQVRLGRPPWYSLPARYTFFCTICIQRKNEGKCRNIPVTLFHSIYILLSVLDKNG